ncbi:diguanylate cyclase [Deinococcus hopiensis]|uniref:Diguanylate cyclase (GGDEF) domain-containing protein/HDIG domain-containing protein n=1 Tax=Deinococcus hopiensis KR-140 TaxID=695939 RepID=A0A1W1VUE1_9DEIO|nr:diguanylate cyclase [Deinococcus hopiensis]SMB96985.1 diguanylate cyclase (GGDEF) domain-containing protein/HDIG domain-containing protein [Deinococcus hopiensis KR-140]
MHDTLTGFLRRPDFEAALLHLSGTLGLVDLTALKQVNALHGHAGGDAFIQHVATVLKEAFPSGTLFCRWGGDEFLLFQPESPEEVVRATLERVNSAALHPLPGLQALAFGTCALWHDMPFSQAFALAEEQLQRMKTRLGAQLAGSWSTTALIEFSRQLEQLNSPAEVIKQGLTQLLTLTDFDVAFHFEWSGRQMRAQYVVSRPGVERAGALAPSTDAWIPRSGLALEVDQRQKTVGVTDYPSSPYALPLLVQANVKSALLAPIRSRGVICGSLSLVSVGRWRTITPQLEHLLDIAALRLEHVLELRRTERAVRMSFEGGLLGLGAALEARDLETHGHTQRVATLSIKLGVLLGLQGQDLDQLRQGAYLHDIGKLAIPDAILLKPGKLTREEWQLMQLHAHKGWEMAQRIPMLPEATLDLIRHHHERWDGRGYPDGLTGENIPLLARIFAVCDVYDALVSVRPYKSAWTVSEALEEVAEQGGRQFDPAVVEVFLKLFQETAEEV